MKTHRSILAAMLLGAVILAGTGSGAAASGTLDSTATFHINDTGGDCPAIGTWDAPSGTCKLNTDIKFDGSWTSGTGIQIDSDGVTLDGNGHTITGPFNEGIGIFERQFVTVRNLQITGFDFGAVLMSTRGCNLTGNNINSNGDVGIQFVGTLSDHNFVTGNTISSNFNTGIRLIGSARNTISGNSLSSRADGVEFYNGSGNNIIRDNDIGSSGVGAYIYSSDGNLFYHNRFLGNTTQARVDSGSGNSFNLPVEGNNGGGNYWSDWTGPDADQDGIVDNAYAFTGGWDFRPLTSESSWPRSYYWNWYDALTARDWVLMSNPAGSQGDQTLDLSIGGMPRDLPAGGSLAPGVVMSAQYPGLMAGPVRVASRSTSGRAIVSQRSLWGDSLEEVQGQDLDALSDHFYWPWYDGLTGGVTDWILVTNPSATETVRAGISFINQEDGQNVFEIRDLAPGENWTPTFPGKMGGPVEVMAYAPGGNWTDEGRDVIASQRVLSNGGTSFNEVPGIPASSISNDYLWSWYDNLSAGYSDWILISNPSYQYPVSYQIKIGGVVLPGGTGTIAPRSTVAPTFPGRQDGPVEVIASAPVIATQRTTAGPSFEEVPGVSRGSLAADYHWTWYDNQSPGSTNWILVANPGDTAADFQIKIAGTAQSCDNCTVPAHGRVFRTFPGVMGGPVEVSSSSPVVASQRELWNGYFNEVPGVR